MSHPLPVRLLGRLRLRQLEMTCLLAELGSMRAVAERMHLSPAALSKSLRELETLVDRPLFLRTTRGLAATPAGEDFIRQARTILNQLTDLGRLSGQGADSTKDTLRLGSAASIAWCVIPDVLKRLSQQGLCPRIHLVEGRIVPLAEQLITGDLDAILTLSTPEVAEILNNEALNVDPLYVEPTVVVCASASEPDLPDSVSWAALHDRRWILPPSTFTQRTLVQRAFLQARVLPPVPFIESIDIPAMLRMAEIGLGLTAVPFSTARRELDRGTLRIVRTRPALASVPVGFAYRRCAPNLAQLRLLRDAVRACRRTVDEIPA
jgi:DNA-binding transcriptional LysR family regulator